LPKGNAPATGEEKPQTYENPILTMKMWVPIIPSDRNTIEGVFPESFYNLGGNRDFSDAYREIDLLPNVLVEITDDYESYDEYVEWGHRSLLNQMYLHLFQAEYEGPIEVTTKEQDNRYVQSNLVDCEVDGMKLFFASGWPKSYIGGANKLSFALQQTAIYEIAQRYEDLFCPICGSCEQFATHDNSEQFTKQYLNDLLETPNVVYESVWREKVEKMADIVCSDLLTGSVKAKATIRVYWYSEWGFQESSPWFDASSAYYGEEYGSEKQLCEDIESMGIRYYPHFTVELIDYWQVVEEE